MFLSETQPVHHERPLTLHVDVSRVCVRHSPQWQADSHSDQSANERPRMGTV
jgi:hypothetical protein